MGLSYTKTILLAENDIYKLSSIDNCHHIRMTLDSLSSEIVDCFMSTIFVIAFTVFLEFEYP